MTSGGGALRRRWSAERREEVGEGARRGVVEHERGRHGRADGGGEGGGELGGGERLWRWHVVHGQLAARPLLLALAHYEWFRPKVLVDGHVIRHLYLTTQQFVPSIEGLPSDGHARHCLDFDLYVSDSIAAFHIHT